MQPTRIIGGCLLAAGLVAVVACNATPEIPNDVQRRAAGNTSEPTSQDSDQTGQTTNDADDAAPAPPAPEKAPVDAGTTDATTDAGAGTVCKNEPTQDSCYKCCDKALPNAIKYLQDAFYECMCKNPGKCKNSCADSYCMDPTVASNDCGYCLDDHEDYCADQAYEKCAADGLCSQLFLCDKTAGCADKPTN